MRTVISLAGVPAAQGSGLALHASDPGCSGVHPALSSSGDGFRELFEAAPVALVLSSFHDHRVLAANPAAAALFGLDADSVRGRYAPAYWVNAEDRERLLLELRERGNVEHFEAELLRSDGSRFWGDIAVRILSGPERGILFSVRDVTRQKRAEAELRELATTDALTGALNRRRLFELAEEELVRESHAARPLALAMLDLDHFKAVNDRFGHQVGDEALKLVTQAVRGGLRRCDHVSRYGGEELAVLLPTTSLVDARRVVERIRRAVEELALEHEGVRVPLTLSAGVVTRRHGESFERLLSRADAALYKAKARGRNRVVAGT